MSEQTNENNASAATTAQEEIDKAHTRHAFLVAKGEATAAEEAIEITGARNDYNAKGRGSTMARRVLRNGSWEWVSKPASRGRYLAGDRKDATRGDVYEGEIIAEFTLGGSGKPNCFMYASQRESAPLVIFEGFARTKEGFKLTAKNGESIMVSDPYWK